MRKYQVPSRWKGTWQLVNTLAPYFALWVAMYFAMSVSWWLVIPLALLAGGFVVRAFIIFHDCTHGSFFKSKRANEITGFFTGVLTFTPYHLWRWEHSIHHSSSGDLDRRGTGDIWTLTVEEDAASSRWRRFTYRMARNPIVLFVIAPALMMLIYQRFPTRRAPKRDNRWLHATNLAIAGMCTLGIWIFGLVPFLIIQLIVLTIASSSGVWLFYVQHQFEDTHWSKPPEWTFQHAAMHGASHYDLPRPLRWITGNIGMHHVHHLSSRIPFYRLPEVLRDHPELTGLGRITISDSLACVKLILWDEASQRLVSLKEAERRL